MQAKQSDAGRILLLTILIIFFIGVAYWQVRRFTAPAQTSSANTTGMTAQTPGAMSSPIEAARAPGTPMSPTNTGSGAPGNPMNSLSSQPSNLKAGVGQTRYFIPALDDDELEEPTLIARNPSAFRAIKPPVLIAMNRTPLPSASNRDGGAGSIPPWGRGKFPPFDPSSMETPAPTRGGTAPSVAPAEIKIARVEYKLDGVMGGPEGYAMFSMRADGQGANAAEQILYRKVGERVEDFVVAAINETGVQLRHARSQKMVRAPWQVGERKMVPATGSYGAPALERPGNYRRTSEM
jgi:hypothetical protein